MLNAWASLFILFFNASCTELTLYDFNNWIFFHFSTGNTDYCVASLDAGWACLSWLLKISVQGRKWHCIFLNSNCSHWGYGNDVWFLNALIKMMIALLKNTQIIRHSQTAGKVAGSLVETCNENPKSSGLYGFRGPKLWSQYSKALKHVFKLPWSQWNLRHMLNFK